jgi:hypothetical protein
MRNRAIHFEQVPMNVVEAVLRRAVASVRTPEEPVEPVPAPERESQPELQEQKKSAQRKGQL